MMRSARLVLALAPIALAGCFVAPAGEAVYGPPAVVAETPGYEFYWGPWPHYEVDHRYVIEDEHVHIRDNHYYPFYETAHPYVHNDQGKHKGWFKHD